MWLRVRCSLLDGVPAVLFSFVLVRRCLCFVNVVCVAGGVGVVLLNVLLIACVIAAFCVVMTFAISVLIVVLIPASLSLLL